MASLKNLKDQRRADLIIPYSSPKSKSDEPTVGDMMSTVLPMAAIFSRSRMIGWSAFVFSIQTWLNETPQQVAAGKQPAYFGIGMAFLGLMTTYIHLFFPVISGSGEPKAAAA